MARAGWTWTEWAVFALTIAGIAVVLWAAIEVASW